MFDTGLEPMTSVVGGRRLDDWATENVSVAQTAGIEPATIWSPARRSIDYTIELPGLELVSNGREIYDFMMNTGSSGRHIIRTAKSESLYGL